MEPIYQEPSFGGRWLVRGGSSATTQSAVAEMQLTVITGLRIRMTTTFAVKRGETRPKENPARQEIPSRRVRQSRSHFRERFVG